MEFVLVSVCLVLVWVGYTIRLLERLADKQNEYHIERIVNKLNDTNSQLERVVEKLNGTNSQLDSIVIKLNEVVDKLKPKEHLYIHIDDDNCLVYLRNCGTKATLVKKVSVRLPNGGLCNVTDTTFTEAIQAYCSLRKMHSLAPMVGGIKKKFIVPCDSSMGILLIRLLQPTEEMWGVVRSFLGECVLLVNDVELHT
jgi:hypothetical protein